MIGGERLEAAGLRPAAVILAAAVLFAGAVWKAGVLAALGLVGVVAVAAVLALRPTVATALAIATLITNLPVVLAQREIVPMAAAAVVPLLFVPGLARHVVARREGIRIDRTFGLMLVLLGIMVLSAFQAAGPDVALTRIGVYASEGLLVYLLVFNAVRGPRELRLAVIASVVGAVLLSSMTVYQAVTGDYDQEFLGLAQRGEPLAADVAPGEVRLEDRSRGPVDDPNRYAQILLMVLPLAAVLFLNARGFGRRIPPLLALVLIGAAVLLTYSRGAFLTLAVLVVIAGAVRMVRPLPLYALMTAAALAVPVLVPGYAERIRSIAGALALVDEDVQVVPDGATRGRTTEMLAALLAWTEHPLLGVGPGQYAQFHSVSYMTRPQVSIRSLVEPRRAHDLYLEIAAETGVLGIAVFMAIPLLLLRDLWRLRRGFRPARPHMARWAEGFGLALLAYLGTGVFLHLSFERYYWFSVALTASGAALLARARAPEPAVEPTGQPGPAHAAPVPVPGAAWHSGLSLRRSGGPAAPPQRRASPRHGRCIRP